MSTRRRITPAVALRDLEHATSLRALAHIFPPESHPYPSDSVLERWRTVLTDPDVVVTVVDDEAGLACLTGSSIPTRTRSSRWRSAPARKSRPPCLQTLPRSMTPAGGGSRGVSPSEQAVCAASMPTRAR